MDALECKNETVKQTNRNSGFRTNQIEVKILHRIRTVQESISGMYYKFKMAIERKRKFVFLWNREEIGSRR